MFGSWGESGASFSAIGLGVGQESYMEHEYSLIGGINRAKIGRWLHVAAALVSACFVFLLLSAINFAQHFGLPVNVPPTVLSLFATGTIFVGLYWLFEKFVWRIPAISQLLRVPNLSGTWICLGQTLNPDHSPGYQWQGTVTIVQSWDKLRVRLKTSQSGSNSVAAALVCDDAEGWILLYDYRNEPRIDQAELRAHRGFAELTIAKDLQTAEGAYFNGHGRFTFGTMKLQRS
jgi:hypothetical protein